MIDLRVSPSSCENSERSETTSQARHSVAPRPFFQCALHLKYTLPKASSGCTIADSQNLSTKPFCIALIYV